MRRAHLIVGVAGIVAFLATGQYMDRWHDHLRGMADPQRLLFRSTHIYLLLASLVNAALGLYLRRDPGGRGAVQALGSLLLLASPPLLVAAFATEPWLTGLERPYSRPALYASLAGMVLHLSRAVPIGRRAPEAPSERSRLPTHDPSP